MPSPIPGDAVAAQQWQAAHDRVVSLVAEVGEDAMRVHVPACPDWTAKDLLAHVVGLGVDVLAGSEPDDHDEAWTQSHVDARRGRSAAEVVAEWQGVAEPLVDHLKTVSARALGDLVIHEQDLRGALERPGARDTEGLAMVRERMAGRVAGRLGDLPPLRLESPGWSWTSGDGEPGAVLRADGYDLARAVTSRRSADELRTYVVEGDVEPYLDAFAALGPLPERSLSE